MLNYLFQKMSLARNKYLSISCPPEGSDGFLDLTLKFDKQQIIAALGDIEDVPNKGDMPLTLSFNLMDDATNYEGIDCVRILKPKTKK